MNLTTKMGTFHIVTSLKAQQTVTRWVLELNSVVAKAFSRKF